MRKKIKILQLGSPAGLYGAERWILALIKYLNPTKVESLVASIRDEPHLEAPLCMEAGKLGFKSHIFESYGKVNWAAVKKVRRFIQENSVDIIHSHGYKTDLISLLAAKGTPCKTLSTPHGWTNKPDFKLFIYELADRFSFYFFDAVAPLSEGLYRSLEIMPAMKKKLHLIKNGVDTGEIDSVRVPAKELVALKKKGGFIIGYIGRLIHGKGLDSLFEALCRYGEPHWNIAMVGEGEQAEALENLARKMEISDRVHFFGFRPDRLSFLKGFDVFVLPSKSEGIPRCLMEAMAAKVPVVASDIPGCRYLVEDKKTGLLFRPGEPRHLADKIRAVASDKSLRELLCQKGKERIFSDFSAAKMAHQYEDLYMSLTENNNV